jgi:glycosyltransferase involved in cell wall biosynthesis
MAEEPLRKIVFFSRYWPLDVGHLARECVTFTNERPHEFRELAEGADLCIEIERNDSVSHFERFAAEAPCPTAVWLIDSHVIEPRHRKILRCYTHVFVAIKRYAELFARFHPSVRWLPLCNTKPFLAPGENPKQWDVGFVGNEFPGHHERTRILDMLEKRLGPGRLFRGTRQGREYERTLQASRIVFNKSVGGIDTNYRIYEAMATGAFVLTDRTPDASLLFREGEHLAFYDDEASLLAKMDYYLAHEAEREAIAARGREEVLSKHLEKDRVLAMVNGSLGRSFTRDDF